MPITNTDVFHLLQDVLQGALSLPLKSIRNSDTDYHLFDSGLRSQLGLQQQYQDFQDMLHQQLPYGTVLHYHDPYHIHYIIASGHSEAAHYFCIGPFRITDLTDQDFVHIQNLAQLSDQQTELLKDFYHCLPNVALPQVLTVTKNIFLSIYGNVPFHVKTVQRSILPEKQHTVAVSQKYMLEDVPVEDILAHENSMVRHASNGDYNSALVDETFLISISTPNSVFDPDHYRHLLTWSNALFRKEGHDSGFPAQPLVELYLTLQRQIDGCTTYYDYLRLRMKMLTEYCNFFQEYSVKDFSPLVRHAINYIRTNLGDNLDLNTLSGALGFSSTYILHKFKKEVGMSPMQFVADQRMRTAERMLVTSGKPIQEIAHAVGIVDMSYFSKQFKKTYGYTPSSYRKHQQTNKTS